MDTKWPYFDVEYGGARFFTSIETVEQALRDGYVVSDDADEETIGNGLGGPSKSFKKRHNNTIEQHLKALKDHPEEYMLLYNLQYTINHFTLERPAEEGSEKFQPARAMVFIDDKTNNIKVDVEMFEPVGADLVIDEGKANFDIKNFNVPKAKAILDLLQRHKLVNGLDNLKLNDADEECQNIIAQAVEELKKEKNRPSKGFMRGESEDYNGNSPVDDDAFEKFSSSDDGGVNQTTASQPQETESRGLKGWWARRRERRKLSSEELENIRKADKIFENWLNKNKVKGRSWQLGYDWNGGWTTYTAYPNESTKRRKHDIEANEKGELKYNYEFKIYTRVRNGKVEIAYSLPPGKILTNTQATLIAAAFKEAGVKYISFNGMTDDNEAAMRTGCAFKGLIPVNHTINFEKFDKMVDSAGTKMDKNSPEFYRYKYDLAMQIDKNLQKKGIDYRDEKNKNNPDCRRIRWTIGAYELHPFRDLWEDFGLRDSYEEKIAVKAMSRGGEQYSDAAYAIGAKMAVSALYDIYGSHRASSVSVLLNGQDGSLNGREKLVLANALQTTNTSLGTKVYDVPPQVFIALYEEIFKTQYEKAEKSLENNFLKALVDAKKYRSQDNPERTAIAKCADNAEISLGNMRNALKEFDIPEITIITPKKYDYNFEPIYKKAVREGLIKPSVKKNRYNRDENDDSDNKENKDTSPRKKMALPGGMRKDSGGR